MEGAKETYIFLCRDVKLLDHIAMCVMFLRYILKVKKFGIYKKILKIIQ